MNGFVFRSRSKAAAASLALLTSATLLTANDAFAQNMPDPMRCQQIRQAAAQYGFANARRHALETYGPEAVKAGDQCFTRQPQQSARLHSRKLRHQHRVAIQ